MFNVLEEAARLSGFSLKRCFSVGSSSLESSRGRKLQRNSPRSAPFLLCRTSGSLLRGLSDPSRPAAAMTPPADLPFSLLFAAAALVMMLMSLPASALEPETCFYREHQGATVNVRLALSREATAMITRNASSYRGCVQACCSEEVQTGETNTSQVTEPDWVYQQPQSIEKTHRRPAEPMIKTIDCSSRM